MEAYFVYNGTLDNQDTAMDPEDAFIDDQPFENNSNQDEIYEPSHSTNSRKSSWRLEWSPYETKMLMDLYRRNVTQVGPMKKFKSKKEMFNFIANTISTRLNISKSAHQCENRYKTVSNQRKAGILSPSILRKTRLSNLGKKFHVEGSQSSATASVSADHDYNGQHLKSNGEFAVKHINEWGLEDTKLLMDLYRKNIIKVGLERTFRTKVKMFEYIAERISNILNITRTAEQCINRYKTLFRRKNRKLNNAINNNMSPKEMFYEGEEEIACTINPNCDTYFVNSICEGELNTHIYDSKTLKKIIDQPKPIPNQIYKEEPSTEIDHETVLTKTLREIAKQKEQTLLKIAANQERAEERRHQETMALIRQLGETLIQCSRNHTNNTSGVQ